MAKWHGKIGYIEQVESSPGIWVEQVTERNYSGDILRNHSGWSSSSEGTNDNLTVNNQISIIADTFAKQNSQFMKYIELMGAKWKITGIDVQYPRLVLTIGGVYNGK